MSPKIVEPELNDCVIYVTDDDTIKFSAIISPVALMSPTTWSFADGHAVPMPTFCAADALIIKLLRMEVGSWE